jgi:enoyl-CoA hydratase
MGFDTIILEKKEGTGIITFNRPKVFNAYNEQMSMELKEAISQIEADNLIRVLVLKGSGDNFMVGADINMLNRWSQVAEEQGVEAVEGILRKYFSPTILENLSIPVLAAIDGMAWGMGCEISLACDFRICTDRASFAQPEINLGVIPGAGATQRLPRIIGKAKAMELILTGTPINAEDANGWGLVNKVVAFEEMDSEVTKLVKRIVAKSPLITSWAKQCVNHTLDHNLYEGIEKELTQFCRTFTSHDCKEGTAAFLEKRKPVFVGK